MLQWFKRRSEVTRTAEKIYGGVVAAARQPVFYERMGVADTPRGRFELVALHLFLALEPLRVGGSEAESIAQRTIEAFVTDMDDCLREMGIGDLAVAKKVKKAAAAFYQRAGEYRRSMANPSNFELEARLKHYMFDADDRDVGAAILARYVRGAAKSLSGAGHEQDLDGAAMVRRLNAIWAVTG